MVAFLILYGVGINFTGLKNCIFEPEKYDCVFNPFSEVEDGSMVVDEEQVEFLMQAILDAGVPQGVAEVNGY